MGLIDLPELLSRHRVTVDEYYRMADVGVLAPEARVELIRGEVVDMAPIGSRHGGCAKILNNRLCAAVGERAVVAVQDPLRIGKHSEPRPDVMVLRLRSDNYRDAHPTPADVLLLIEVSDTTARYDREIKLPLYAEAGVPEVWIVDIDAQLLRCHRRPAGLEYTEMQALPAPSLIAVPGVEGAKLELGDLFG